MSTRIRYKLSDNGGELTSVQNYVAGSDLAHVKIVSTATSFDVYILDGMNEELVVPTSCKSLALAKKMAKILLKAAGVQFLEEVRVTRKTHNSPAPLTEASSELADVLD